MVTWFTWLCTNKTAPPICGAFHFPSAHLRHCAQKFIALIQVVHHQSLVVEEELETPNLTAHDAFNVQQIQALASSKLFFRFLLEALTAGLVLRTVIVDPTVHCNMQERCRVLLLTTTSEWVMDRYQVSDCAHMSETEFMNRQSGPVD